jgi:hypothetical protein
VRDFGQEQAAGITALSVNVRHIQELTISVQGSLMASSLCQWCAVFQCISDSLYLQPAHHLQHCSSEQLCWDSQADLEHLHGNTHADYILGITHVFRIDLYSATAGVSRRKWQAALIYCTTACTMNDYKSLAVMTLAHSGFRTPAIQLEGQITWCTTPVVTRCASLGV